MYSDVQVDDLQFDLSIFDFEDIVCPLCDSYSVSQGEGCYSCSRCGVRWHDRPLSLSNG